FLLEKQKDDSEYMQKLNQQKIRWIIKQIDKQELSTYRIAKTQNITPRWARELHTKFHTIYRYPYPKKPGRKTKPITEEEKKTILKIHKQHPLNALTLEKILDEQGIHIGHNRIHKILKQEGLTKDEPHKQRRRKWVRYERKYSNSLWHADWFEQKHEQIILFEDDASRLITGYGVFSNANMTNSVQVLNHAINTYGIPKQMMTDHGVQFTSLPRETCTDPKPNEFQQLLKQHGILHIKARVKHPQSNGKVERAAQTIQQLRKHFTSWEQTVYYYNFKRPHSSLENGHLRTPYEAFIDKMREKEKKGC
ncbi:MAG: DDE-type integrase/transposase/recombinase, partial [Candidatus Bathyarchaeia archaeon]